MAQLSLGMIARDITIITIATDIVENICRGGPRSTRDTIQGYMLQLTIPELL